MTVSSFRTPHDSNMSVGYRIEFEDRGKKRAIGVATDIGYVSDSVKSGLSGCEVVVLESNHDVEMLEEGPYPYDLKQRIRSNRGHLSNTDCACFASELACQGTKAFILAHLSEENNTKELALDTVKRALPNEGIVISVSDPDHPVFM